MELFPQSARSPSKEEPTVRTALTVATNWPKNKTFLLPVFPSADNLGDAGPIRARILSARKNDGYRIDDTPDEAESILASPLGLDRRRR
jgi:hypothetical protein